MAGTFVNATTQRCALVTGANKGIGFEICKQLASKGIKVILTARDEKRGIEAQERLKEFGVSKNVVFHQLDVVDPASIASVVDFIKSKFRKLDILVNNAGVIGITGVEQTNNSISEDVLIFHELLLDSLDFAYGETERAQPKANGNFIEPRAQPKANGNFIEPLKDAEDCLQTNYFGAKRLTEALIPLLQLSDSPRIVNVSSTFGNLKFLPNEWAKKVLSGNEENLTEEKIDEVVQKFLKSLEEGSLEANEWPTQVAAYKISKVALNAYTRLAARKYPSFRINCVCPGYARTDITSDLAQISAEEAAEGPVKLALLPNGGPSGLFFKQKDISPF